MTSWNISNFKALQIDNLYNDPLQAELRSPKDVWLDFIIEFRQMPLNIAGSQGIRMK